MKYVLTTLITLLLCGTTYSCTAGWRYGVEAETGYLFYNYRLVTVDPGPNWKGYNLNREQNAISINIVNGLRFSDRTFAGIGTGYVNFEGVSGWSLYAHTEYVLFEKKISPVFCFNLGYNQIYNQYENGTGTVLAEPGVGIRYKVNNKTSIYLRTGLLLMQQSLLVPVYAGISI